MTLPLLVSVPHSGLRVPDEVEDLCVLSEKDIIRDSDEGAAEIYLPLKQEAAALVTTDVARAILDMNRSEDDRRKDGIVKTNTCWDVMVYREFPSEKVIKALIENYYKPYHSDLSRLAKGVKLGLDCHTMAAEGPPVGPDPGAKRPHICLSNADGTCDQGWIELFSESLEKAFETRVSINHPFKGGHIIRAHAEELPWMQLELSREPFMTNQEKSRCVLKAMEDWCHKMP